MGHENAKQGAATCSTSRQQRRLKAGIASRHGHRTDMWETGEELPWDRSPVLRVIAFRLLPFRSQRRVYWQIARLSGICPHRDPHVPIDAAAALQVWSHDGGMKEEDDEVEERCGLWNLRSEA